ncbi:MAG TPA: hypothetical protein VMU05_19050 [Dongiaceae bacterium]|nr:hypothetical protein [Dongiaceae bacterium]
MASSRSIRDFWYYIVAMGCGIGTGWADVTANDLLFTALLVVFSCMMLGLLRPRAPWRWVLIVGAMIPLSEYAASKFLTVKPTRDQMYGSILDFLPGIAGAYGGSFMRRVVENLKGKK